MNEDTLNMEIRKFLKKVGITSQREIEHAISQALDSKKITANARLPVKVTLTMEDLELEHDVTGHISLE